MESTDSKKLNWRVAIAVVTAFTLVFAAFSPTALTAYAEKDDHDEEREGHNEKASSNNYHEDEEYSIQHEGDSKAKLKALPKKSLVDDGNSQLLELKFKLKDGTLFQFVRLTIDPDTPDEEVVEFDSVGNPLPGFDPLQPPFELIFGQITLLSDEYYAIGKAKGKFVIALNKTDLGPGKHKAVAEVMLEGQDDLTAKAEFLLKPSVPILPDLVAKYFFAPTTIKKPLTYWAFLIETNEGHKDAKEHKITLYLSDDNALGGDTELDKENNDKLKAGWFDLIALKIKVPKHEDTGPAYLIVKADSTDKIQEIHEDNNTKSKATNITAY